MEKSNPFSINQRIILLRIILTLLMVTLGIISLGYYFIYTEQHLPHLISTFASLIFLLPLYLALNLSRAGRYELAARMTVGVVVLVIFTLAVIRIQDHGLDMLFYLIFPVLLAGLLLSQAEALVTLGISLAGMLVFTLISPEAGFVNIPFVSTLVVSVVFILSIDYLKREEQERQVALQESELRYRSLVENAPEAILVFNQITGTILDANQKALALFGYYYEDLLATSILDLFPDQLVRDPLYSQSIRDVFNHNLDEQAPAFECTLQRQDGTHLPCEIWIAPFPSSGDPLIRASILDLRDRKEMENALFRAHLHTQGLIEAIHSLVIEIDQDNTIIFWNQYAEKVFGISIMEAIQADFFSLSISWDWQVVREAIQKCSEQGESVSLHDMKYERPNRQPGFLDLVLVPIPKGETALPDIILTGNDITEPKLLYDQIYQAEKLRALGELSAGIAHEINSPMQYISNNLTFLQEEMTRLLPLLETIAALNASLEQPEEMEYSGSLTTLMREIDLEYLREEIPLAFEQSAEGIKRITSIVHAMREFSHPGNKEKSLTDLNRAILSTITIARNEWKYACNLKTDLDPSLPLVPCFPAEFNQAILNLITNASDAIKVEVEKGRYSKGDISICTKSEDCWVLIDFEDNGCGISEDNCDRIFEPFFTTKEVGKGTGQGLAITHRIIVKKLQGAIEVHSIPGEGTRFRIKLPLDSADYEIELEEVD